MVLTMTSWLSSGRPRQFIEMCENSRCSILFHLDVPGGKWQTVMSRPVSSARWRALESPLRWTTKSVPHLAEAGGSPPDKHSGDRPRGAAARSRFAAGDFSDELQFLGVDGFVDFLRRATCCAV